MSFILVAVGGYFFVKKGAETVDSLTGAGPALCARGDYAMRVTTDTVSDLQSAAQRVSAIPERLETERERRDYERRSNAIREKYSVSTRPSAAEKRVRPALHKNRLEK